MRIPEILELFSEAIRLFPADYQAINFKTAYFRETDISGNEDIAACFPFSQEDNYFELIFHFDTYTWGLKNSETLKEIKIK